MEQASFIVDLNDPSDMREKLTEARAILDSHEASLRDLDRIQRLVEKWRVRVAFLESQVPEEPREAGGTSLNDASAPPIGDLVVEVVGRENRKIRSKDVRTALLADGHEFSANQVSNALYYAAHTANPPRIRSAVGRGMYAPLSYQELERVVTMGDQVLSRTGAPVDDGAASQADPNQTRTLEGGTHEMNKRLRSSLDN
jgi:hypothetical protein